MKTQTFTMYLTLYVVLIELILVSNVSSKRSKSYTTGISDLVRNAIQRGLQRLTTRSNSYDSDVFRYSQLTERYGRALHAGESCRLSTSYCSRDEQCCSARCLCRRWTITGEERCVRKCY